MKTGEDLAAFARDSAAAMSAFTRQPEFVRSLIPSRPAVAGPEDAVDESAGNVEESVDTPAETGAEEEDVAGNDIPPPAGVDSSSGNWCRCVSI